MVERSFAAQSRHLFALMALIALLLASNRLVPAVSDVGAGLAILAFALPITALLFWRRRLRRRAFLDIYLNSTSYWHRWLRGGAPMLLIQFATAIILSAFLLVGLMRAETEWFWLTLLGILPVWVFSHPFFARYVSRHFSTRYCRLMTDWLHGWTHAAILLLAIVAWSFFQPVPDVSGASLNNAIRIFADKPRVESDVLQLGLIVSGALAAIPNWLIQNYDAYFPSLLLRLLLWAFIILREWLFVLPLMLLFQSVDMIVDGNWSVRAKEMRGDKTGG